jgi:5'-nucleotidase
MRLLALFPAVFACRKTPVEPTVPPPPVTLAVAATNDFHGGLYEAEVRGHDDVVFGGLPWLVATVNALRAEHPGLILLDGGDAFQGSWPVNATNGRGAVEAFELLGHDAVAVGNHEFDYGGLPGGHPLRGSLEAAAAAADYPFLTANVYEADGTRWDPPNVLPWTVIERDGVRIAVVGLTTTDTPTTTAPGNVVDLEFRDPVATIQALLPEIEAANVQVKVLVAHLTGACKPGSYVRNDDPCTPEGEIGRLLTELPEGTFDLMVLGHAHTVLHHRVGQTFLLENRSGGHLLGRVDLVVGPDGVDADASTVHDPLPIVHPPTDPGCEDRPFPIDPVDVGGRALTPDPAALTLIEALETEVGSLCNELTCASRALYRDRTGESELGDWMADAMLAAFPGADLAVTNSGGIRADLPDGVVRRESLQRVMPFDNRTVLVELTGAQLRTMFRIGASGAHGLLQVSGASYHADKDKVGGSDLDGDSEIADWERDHLCSVAVGGKPLDDTRTYKLVTSDFLLGGGDDLGPAFVGAKVADQGPLLRDVLYRHAERTEGCIGDRPLVDPKKPRIRIGACK